MILIRFLYDESKSHAPKNVVITCLKVYEI